MLFKQKRQAWLREKQLLNLFCLIEEKPVDLQKMEQYFLGLPIFVCVVSCLVVVVVVEAFFQHGCFLCPSGCGFESEKAILNQFSFIFQNNSTKIQKHIEPAYFSSNFPIISPFDSLG
jgi:hypothetical protein